MKQSGFTLLEILVAMLVLAVGLLGLAGLMTSSMRNNLSASHRTQATWMAYDIVDRMRANRAAAVTGNYATAIGTPGACSTAVPTGTVPQQDIAAWKNQLACVLPAGDGSVAVDAATRVATIVVQWNDSRGLVDSGSAANQAAKTFRVETQL
ncbi:type IV pilus modification protein PilV [Thiobacillus sedimenti]|uniref:Type IV pilus modification protein PilV n=1 Tax=Thiobacillus sedimenti TaxID=3110231 RepID=A0ABZ1CGQ3_9PROT|nr:type IV pilus modification protein PilV [Thiobacillus sp. SCUT-2]WRS38391.1 type IV pilus modification protein PilV [Thiobacillus sp. SCUT-2]